MRIRITPNVDTFYALNIFNIFETLQQIVGKNVWTKDVIHAEMESRQ